MVELICQICGNTYSRVPSAAIKSKHCSRRCHNKVAGILGGKAGKGRPKIGHPRPDLAEYNRTHIKRGAQISTWKGDEVGYIAIHNWAHLHVKLKDSCELCGSKEILEMANRSQQYKRELDDWQTLCKKCHVTKDSSFRRNGGVSRKLHKWKKQNPR